MFSGKHNTTASASPLNQFQDICRKAVKTSLGRLHKSFNNILAEISLLMLLLPHKANFTQLEKYGKHSESCYRQNFSRPVDWLKLNVNLAEMRLGSGRRRAIAIDPSFISKSGVKTPGIGRFWSGCAGAVKKGLERDSLIALSRYIVADAYFSVKPFADGLCSSGFHLISRLRDNASLRYLYEGPRSTGRGRPKMIEFCFRDAKQYTGLCDCQARELGKLDFHFNASFCSLNVAKVYIKEYNPGISVAGLKSLLYNTFIANRILSACGLRPHWSLNDKIFKELYIFAAPAA